MTDFDKLLLEAVDEASVSLGCSVKQMFYFHLEKSFGLRKEDVPKRIRTFAQVIEAIFGPGAYYLESLIMKRLHEKVGIVFKWNESKPFGFADYVAEAKRCFRKKNRIKAIETVILCEESELPKSKEDELCASWKRMTEPSRLQFQSNQNRRGSENYV